MTIIGKIKADPYFSVVVVVAVKPLVYLFLIMASTEPQKLLFRGVPGGSRLGLNGQSM